MTLANVLPPVIHRGRERVLQPTPGQSIPPVPHLFPGRGRGRTLYGLGQIQDVSAGDHMLPVGVAAQAYIYEVPTPFYIGFPGINDDDGRWRTWSTGQWAVWFQTTTSSGDSDVNGVSCRLLRDGTEVAEITQASSSTPGAPPDAEIAQGVAIVDALTTHLWEFEVTTGSGGTFDVSLAFVMWAQ